MTRKTLNNQLVVITKIIFVTLAVLCVFTRAALAEKIKLTLQDAPLMFAYILE